MRSASPAARVDLARIVLERLDPVLDVGGAVAVAVLRGMADPDTFAGHHGAELGAEFLAGVGGAAEAGLDALLERLAVQPAFVAGRVRQLVERGGVVLLGARKLGALRKHDLVGLRGVVGAVPGGSA